MNHRLWLIPALALSLCAGCAAPEPSAQSQWRLLEADLERPNLYQDSIGWKAYFDKMIERGIRPSQTRRYCMLMARHSSRRTLIKLITENKTKAALLDALQLEISAARDENRFRRDDFQYKHFPEGITNREVTWDTLSVRLERPPIHGDAVGWRGIYDQMVNMGMDPPIAARNIWRLARFGPSRLDTAKIMESNKTPDKLQAALDIAHTEALDAQWEQEGSMLGYSHPAPGKKVGSLKRMRKESTIRGTLPADAPPAEADAPPTEADAPPTEADAPPTEPDAPPEPEIDETTIDEADTMEDDMDLDAEDWDLDSDPDLDAEIEALEGLEDEDMEDLGDDDLDDLDDDDMDDLEDDDDMDDLEDEGDGRGMGDR